MMCLKSGLLAESTWALNVLSILLFDDSTVMFFGLQHMPGLVESLLDHFRHCLVEIFGNTFEDLEVGLESRQDFKDSLAAKKEARHKQEVTPCSLGEGEDDDDDDDDDLFAPKSPAPFTVPDPEVLNQENNFTLKTRNGREVQIEEDSEYSDIMFDEKKWDVFVGFKSSAAKWQMGSGDISVHVLTHFNSEDSLRFHRRQFFRKRKRKRTATDGHSEKENVDTMDTQVSSTENCPATSGQCSDKQSEDTSVRCCGSEQRETDISDTNGDDTKNGLGSRLKESEPKVIDSTTDRECSSPGQCPENTDQCSSETSAGCSLDIKKEPSDSPKATGDDPIKAEPMECENGNCGIECKTETVKDEACASAATTTTTTTTSGDNNIKKENCEEGSKQPEKSYSEDGPVRSPCVAEDGTPLSDVACLDKLKRKWEEFSGQDMEAFLEDQPSLLLVSESQIELSRRCVCISNILRSLSFIPGNESQISGHHGLMLVLSKLLLLHHVHPKLRNEPNKFERDTEVDSEDVLCDSHEQWWWDCLHALRENVLVIFANICGRLKMNVYPEEICLPIFDGLLHWVVCPSSYAQDPMPCTSTNSVLSPQRLVLEALCKLCVTEDNVDLLLATPPFSRIVHLFTILVRMLADRSEQVMREFAINLLSSMVQSGSSAARAVALQHPAISLLLDFVESAEQQAMQIANSHGVNMLRDNPEMMGTSLDMLRRAANILLCLARVPENRPLFMQHQQRLLSLVMSQILDQHVACIISDVLYNCSQCS